MPVTRPSSSLAALPLLASPQTYEPCETNLLIDHSAREYWLDLFRSHTEVLLDAARQSGADPAAIDAARAAWIDELDAIIRRPDRFGRLDILLLDELRRAVLDRHGIHDEFRIIKQRENDRALHELPAWLAALDATEDRQQRLRRIVHGMLAGNLFDMGVPETASQFNEAGLGFAEALERVPARPWFIDDLDDACAHLCNASLRSVLLFADNAGADFVLGVIPLVRFLLDSAESVIIAANEGPSHNDVTAAEAMALLQAAAAHEPRLVSPRVRVRSNGHAAPLIDLRRVSAKLACEVGGAAGCDLVVLIGMGRSVESNLSARFTCASWKVAMIKDPCVAATAGGNVFDAVCRFERGVDESFDHAGNSGAVV